MRLGDRVLQRWRISKAARWIKPGGRLLDIGCADGAIFDFLGSKVAAGIGIDPDLDAIKSNRPSRSNWVPIKGFFPEQLPDSIPFDAITLLAVLEHIPTDAQPKLADDCYRHLNPGGRLIITVPAPLVDKILSILKALRIVDGMSLEEHYGFRPEDTPSIFERANFRLVAHRRFQLGLNHLFVFEK